MKAYKNNKFQFTQKEKKQTNINMNSSKSSWYRCKTVGREVYLDKLVYGFAYLNMHFKNLNMNIGKGGICAFVYSW